LNFQDYRPKNKVRFVTATSLFDGHDASINIMRRLLQARGAEVIHLGHNRSAHEVVISAIEEDVHAVALSSYQGGHVEYFKYIRDLLNELGGSHIKIFGGGGGVITPKEAKLLEQHGITKIYSPEDGQKLGLAGIIGHMLHESDYAITEWGNCDNSPRTQLARALTLLEGKSLSTKDISARLTKNQKQTKKVPILGVTGTGGAGKSSLTDELIARFVFDMPNIKVGALCIDPSKSKTGGALLGDRIRMNTACHDRVFIRSVATRGSGSEISDITKDALALFTTQDFDFVIVETSGIGQADSEIKEMADCSLYVMTAEYGAATQLEKIEMLDYADLIAINKFERRQSLDAIRDVRTYLRRTRFQGRRGDETDYPVFGTIASRFEDDGVNGLYRALCEKLNEVLGSKRFVPASARKFSAESTNREALIPGNRINYLSEISGVVRSYHKNAQSQIELVKRAEAYEMVAETVSGDVKTLAPQLREEAKTLWNKVDPLARTALNEWDQIARNYSSEEFSFQVRDRAVKVQTKVRSLSQVDLPKIALPRFESKADLLKYLLKENIPGYFPYTGGLFPFRRTSEDPKRQFAGEGGPLRTNKRFHYLCKEDQAKRLSTAFDSVTLYGSEPDKRPDIYGKVGEAGVSIATLDDMKVLYSGFDLCDPSTSVSMTINGPAPIILAMFLNTAIDQQIDAFTKKNGRIPQLAEHADIMKRTMQVVRGTVQADILKEDQAQNTCIFSIEFALKLMGDIQEYFIENQVRNYYSVSISGYHIAEAGANPVTQLALTLANGFTYVEYYLARGMKIDDFAPNLSFFFSNGLDPEYSVIGRVARRIWAVAMRDIYRGSERSQKLKYHIQTSGRSLHAQEIAFNDIRTTLQALVALYDNCNSLHTNAYDEAITTPTEESVRRAMAIQMIINKEFGPNKCENINQGSFFLEELTDLVEEAVLKEFDRLAARGGVLGAMESQYQRSKIQEESLYYESLKDSGELPLIGVNTYLDPNPSEQNRDQVALIRSSYEEKDDQLHRLQKFKDARRDQKEAALAKLCDAVMQQKNVFAELMHTVRCASLGEITEAMYRVGGKYRRSM
jgi:isobutyryl-CoA mutase